MNKLHETLEICLNEIEQGVDVETILFRYPDQAAELRPIIETAVKAKGMAVSAPSHEVVRRNRAKLLQHVAQMREQKNAPAARRIWSVPLRRALVTLMVIAMLFVSGTGLVRASSTTLPGDNLYPVKRTWEDFQVFFTFDTAKREVLELEHENERLDELHELIIQGRTAKVDFSGYVKNQTGNEWQIDGVAIMVSSQTRLPNQPVVVGDAVHVDGLVQSDGVILAEKIKLLPPGSILPEDNGDDDDNDVVLKEEHESENSDQQVVVNSDDVSKTEVPKPVATLTLIPKTESKEVSLEGSVTSIENNFVVVNGIVMDISKAEIKGTPRAGAIANVEGYYDANGIFIVIKIEFKTIDFGINNKPGSDDSVDDTRSNTNENDNDNHNENENHNDNYNDNSNTNSNDD